MIKTVETDQSPKAIGPYSQAVLINNFLFVSGQIPLDPKTMNIIDGNFEKQVSQCLNNIKGILSEQNIDLKNIVKLTVFLKDISNFSIVNDVFEDFFNDNYYPARSLVEVSKLPKDSNIEIEAICYCEK